MSGKKTDNIPKLVDRFGREHTYLRLSVTEQCNFRCSYCKPFNQVFNSAAYALSPHEIGYICGEFVKLGINKIRLTGGEPLIRKDFNLIAKEIGILNIEKAITTNGMLLDKYLSVLKSNGFKTINISLDTLNSIKFKEITGSDSFQRVYSNILEAVKKGFRIKINTVIIKGVNESEIPDFAKMAIKLPIDIRFIEFMPFTDNNWNTDNLYTQEQILSDLNAKFKLEMDPGENLNNPAKYYQIKDGKGKIGLISSVSKPFCSACNRIRITSDGKIKSCLFGISEIDLKDGFKKKTSLSQIILTSLAGKPLQHGGRQIIDDKHDENNKAIKMYAIGG